ncbi:UNVERIFIED_CONTAM: hypothetical protein GTU68_008252 [Idotea baltica]|nr:hypothetical protein [Idotea baltica]
MDLHKQLVKLLLKMALFKDASLLLILILFQSAYEPIYI